MMEVHSFTEYHGSTEQDFGKMEKSYADFTIRHYGSANRLPLMAAREIHPLKTTRIREEDTMFIRLSASLLGQISQVRRKGSCQETQTNRD